jgi:hypothetical protein
MCYLHSFVSVHGVAGHVARIGGNINAWELLTGKREGERLMFVCISRKLCVTVRTGLIWLSTGIKAGFYDHCNNPLCFMKRGEFDCLNNYLSKLSRWACLEGP